MCNEDVISHLIMFSIVSVNSLHLQYLLRDCRPESYFFHVDDFLPCQVFLFAGNWYIFKIFLYKIYINHISFENFFVVENWSLFCYMYLCIYIVFGLYKYRFCIHHRMPFYFFMEWSELKQFLYTVTVQNKRPMGRIALTPESSRPYFPQSLYIYM